MHIYVEICININVYIYITPFLMYPFNRHGNPRSGNTCENLGEQERALRDKLVGFI